MPPVHAAAAPAPPTLPPSALAPWVAPTCGRRRGTPLLCLPPAGAGASAYRAWAEALGNVVDVWPVQLPGREG